MAPLRTTRTVQQNGLAIRAIREKDGWTLTGFAEHLGVAKSEISKIENESKPVNVLVLNRIATALSVPVGALMRDKPIPVRVNDADEIVEVA